MLLQASAAALPIVTTDIGGTSEVAEHEKTGSVAPPRDPQALAAAMLRVSTLSADARRSMGMAWARP